MEHWKEPDEDILEGRLYAKLKRVRNPSNYYYRTMSSNKYLEGYTYDEGK